MQEWWLSTEKMTVYAKVVQGRVVETSPIINVFLGQPLDNLRRWLRRQGGFRQKELSSDGAQ